MKIDTKVLLALAVLLLLTGAGVAYGGYRFSLTRDALSVSETRANTLELTLGKLREDYRVLEEAFTGEKARNDAFASQISDISGTVGKLDKLSKTDPELLQKYSKVYFLNENYEPSAFEKIPTEYIFGEDDEYIHGEVSAFLKDLLEDAHADGIDMRVISGYRSFKTQGSLKVTYRVTYGSGANAFSADQGYSEHQLGTTVDFTTVAIGSSFAGFDVSEAYAWLEKNASRYGFVLSYPKDNAYYQYEPWHWRFVGRDLARDLRRDGKYFYDLDQRTLDEYLISIFD
jgi:D-alanyl-D-alanine carboxypeptidase